MFMFLLLMSVSANYQNLESRILRLISVYINKLYMSELFRTYDWWLRRAFSLNC